jgi:hypothetical protein
MMMRQAERDCWIAALYYQGTTISELALCATWLGDAELVLIDRCIMADGDEWAGMGSS